MNVVKGIIVGMQEKHELIDPSLGLDVVALNLTTGKWKYYGSVKQAAEKARITYRSMYKSVGDNAVGVYNSVGDIIYLPRNSIGYTIGQPSTGQIIDDHKAWMPKGSVIILTNGKSYSVPKNDVRSSIITSAHRNKKVRPYRVMNSGGYACVVYTNVNKAKKAIAYFDSIKKMASTYGLDYSFLNKVLCQDKSTYIEYTIVYSLL